MFGCLLLFGFSVHFNLQFVTLWEETLFGYMLIVEEPLIYAI